MSGVIAFTKIQLPYGWLGNMSPHRIVYDSLVWNTAEALFQALRFTERSEVRKLIRAEKSPMSAKMVAKANADKMVVVPCSSEDVANMTKVVQLKLLFHSDLKMELLRTGDKTIVEDVSSRPGSGNHRFWGAALVDGEWVGENALGKIWMDVRSKLRISDKIQPPVDN